MTSYLRKHEIKIGKVRTADTHPADESNIYNVLIKDDIFNGKLSLHPRTRRAIIIGGIYFNSSDHWDITPEPGLDYIEITDEICSAIRIFLTGPESKFNLRGYNFSQTKRAVFEACRYGAGRYPDSVNHLTCYKSSGPQFTPHEDKLSILINDLLTSDISGKIGISATSLAQRKLDFFDLNGSTYRKSWSRKSILSTLLHLDPHNKVVIEEINRHGRASSFYKAIKNIPFLKGSTSKRAIPGFEKLGKQRVYTIDIDIFSAHKYQTLNDPSKN